jgi:hypothetical protein
LKYTATPSTVLAVYALAIFSVCLFKFDLAFFNDSKDYIAFGYSYSNSTIHRFLLQIWPQYYYATSLLALCCVLYLVRRVHWSLLVFLLHPYYLLLVFTATKEQLVFIGLFFIFVYYRHPGNKHGWASTAVAVITVPLLSMRKAYVPFFIATLLSPINRLKQVNVIYFVGILVVVALGFKYSQQIASGIEFLQSRSAYAHIGRDYFPSLCLAEKADSVSFISCWANTRFGFMFHEQVFSFNYVIHLTFLASFWFVIYLALKFERPFGLAIVVAMLAYHLLGSWWGPVQGAAERYFAPILWCVYLLALGRIIRSGCPKQAQWQFRARLLSQKVKFRLAELPMSAATQP